MTEGFESKDVFTTGEAASICQVSQQTIIRCFDKGTLGGFRIPGSRDRRIPRTELLHFMHKHNIPADRLDRRQQRILLATADSRIAEACRRLFRDRVDVRLSVARNGYEVGAMISTFKPHLLLLDLDEPDIQGDAVCANLAMTKSAPKIMLVARSDNDRARPLLRQGRAHALAAKPLRIEILRDTLDRRLEPSPS